MDIFNFCDSPSFLTPVLFILAPGFKKSYITGGHHEKVSRIYDQSNHFNTTIKVVLPLGLCTKTATVIAPRILQNFGV